MQVRRHESPQISVTADRESPFTFEELFFSRTNPRGIIESGNSVFQRVSEYAWDELIGKPHNVIRHPDMPRGVFWLLWDYLKRGEPIGAYVKNRAKDGRFYWVYALVTPVESGFLSVRLKPSVLLSTVQAEYKALLAIEQGEKLHARDSAALLLERLKALGFETYKAFMTEALGKEMAARDGQIGRSADRTMDLFGELVAAAGGLLEKTTAIFGAYEANRYVPLNLRIQARQLGEAGTAIGVISNNYNLISLEIREDLTRFAASAQDVLSSITDGRFQLGVARLQHEVVDYFRNEKNADLRSFGDDMALLDQQRAAYREKAIAGLRAIVSRTERFAQDCASIKHLAAGLEVTRIMGKMESARLTGAREGVDGLMDDLQSFQATIASCIAEIGGFTRHIEDNARQLGRLMAA